MGSVMYKMNMVNSVDFSKYISQLHTDTEKGWIEIPELNIE